MPRPAHNPSLGHKRHGDCRTAADTVRTHWVASSADAGVAGAVSSSPPAAVNKKHCSNHDKGPGMSEHHFLMDCVFLCGTRLCANGWSSGMFPHSAAHVSGERPYEILADAQTPNRKLNSRSLRLTCSVIVMVHNNKYSGFRIQHRSALRWLSKHAVQTVFLHPIHERWGPGFWPA